MAVYTATRSGTRVPSTASGLAQNLKRAWGTIEFTATPLLGDTIQMCKLPKGAMIVGGALKGDKLDSYATGSSLMSVNIGLDKAITCADGTAVTALSTSTALASAWNLGPDAAAVAGYKPDVGVRNVPLGGLLLTNGPLLTSDETIAYITVNASAVAFTSGTITLEVDYYTAQHS